MQSEIAECKRILIIKLGSIGDVVMATPVAKALRHAYPDAHIAWAVEGKSRDVLIGNPHLDDVIVLDRKWSTKSGFTEAAGTLTGILNSSPEIRAGRFDTTIDLQGLLRSALVGTISGAKLRIGFDSAGEGAPLLYTKRLKTSGNRTRGPLDYLSLLTLLGIESDDIDMHVPISDADRTHVACLIQEFADGSAVPPIAALCPSTTWPQKHWTEYGWARLADTLSAMHGMLPVFMGAGGDRPLIDRILGMMKRRAVSAAGRTTINQAAAFVERSSLVVAVDTGLLHMAVGLNRPTIGIFGPTSWRHLARNPMFRVVSRECPHSPCLRRPMCKQYDCMNAVSARDIIDAAAGWLPQPSVEHSRSVAVHANPQSSSELDEGRPLRTVQVETGMHSLGGSVQVIYLLKELARRGHEALLVCPKGSSICDQAISAGIDVHPLTLGTDLDFSFVFRLSAILSHLRPDIVHLHSRRGADIMGGLAARIAGVPGIILSRRIDNPVHPGSLSRLKYCSLCDRIIAISDGVRDALVKGGVDQSRIIRVRSAVDAAAYQADRRAGLRDELGIPDGAVVLGTIAQLIERKGHRYLLEAMPAILERFPNTVVLILGQGHIRSRIEDYVESLGIRQNVIFGGFRNDIPSVLREIDILVHPATMEGLGVSILQAMSAGIPVIASAVGGIPEAVRDGISGVLIPPENARAIRDAVLLLLADPGLRETMGSAGKQIVEEDFSVDRMVDGVIAVYRDVLQRKSLVS